PCARSPAAAANARRANDHCRRRPFERAHRGPWLGPPASAHHRCDQRRLAGAAAGVRGDPNAVDAVDVAERPVRRAITAAGVDPQPSDAAAVPDVVVATGTIGPVFLRYFLNSMIVSLSTTVLGVLIAIPAAYAFSRFQFPGRDILFFAVLVRNMFPVVVFLIPLFILMRTLHLVNTHWSLF